VLAKHGGKVLARREAALKRDIGDSLFVIDRENPAGTFNPAAVEIFLRRHIGQFVAVVSESASPQPALPRHGLQGPGMFNLITQGRQKQSHRTAA
jgi:hypothetical protein